jgi:transcriptional regulator with XRE-family HTH domain
MLTIKEIRRQLKDSSLCKVSKSSGLTYPTLRRIMTGDENINIKTLNKISKYIYRLRINNEKDNINY